MATETVCLKCWALTHSACVSLRLRQKVLSPGRLAWEQRDVWGGEVADLDGDGIVDFFLRSSRGSYFQVFSAGGDDTYVERAVITPPGEGTNEMGQRQIVGDLDGDGRGELIGGDGDGDLFVFEADSPRCLSIDLVLGGSGRCPHGGRGSRFRRRWTAGVCRSAFL